MAQAQCTVFLKRMGSQTLYFCPNDLCPSGLNNPFCKYSSFMPQLQSLSTLLKHLCFKQFFCFFFLIREGCCMEERKSEGRAWENQIVLCFIPFGSVPLWVLLPMHFHPIFCPRRLYPGIASPGPQHSLVPVEFGQREQIRGQVGREIRAFLCWLTSMVCHGAPETVRLCCSVLNKVSPFFRLLRPSAYQQIISIDSRRFPAAAGPGQLPSDSSH